MGNRAWEKEVSEYKVKKADTEVPAFLGVETNFHSIFYLAVEAASTIISAAAKDDENPDNAAAVIVSTEEAATATTASTAEQQKDDNPTAGEAISFVAGASSSTLCCR